MSSTFRLAWQMALSVLVVGCAARQPPRNVVAESAALVRSGCYRCLEEALALLDKRTDVVSRQRAFEVALLLTARSKELGLPSQRWHDRAKALAAGLPAASATAAFLALADALPPDTASLDSDQEFAVRRSLAPPSAVLAWTAAMDASSASAEAKVYFTVAGYCALVTAERDSVTVASLDVAAGVPLLQYALGNCSSAMEQLLWRALELEPRFDDAAYPLGRYLLNRYIVIRPESDPSAHLARARAAFPDSPAIAYVEATFFQARREWLRAVEAFNAVLRLVPRHHQARLGRAIALSQLARNLEAIAGLTPLIKEGRWLVGDAYYWRSWNHFALSQLDDSERDVEEAKQRTRSGAVFVLSGLVQWRKQRPTVAESELEQAVAIAADDCDAQTYLGGVRVELRKWAPAAEAFGAAETCRDKEVRMLRATLTNMVAHGAPAAAVESQQKSIATSEQQAAEMAYNRGAMLVNVGDVAAAQPHIERASQHPTLHTKALDLLERLRARQQ